MCFLSAETEFAMSSERLPPPQPQIWPYRGWTENNVIQRWLICSLEDTNFSRWNFLPSQLNSGTFRLLVSTCHQKTTNHLCSSKTSSLSGFSFPPWYFCFSHRALFSFSGQQKSRRCLLRVPQSGVSLSYIQGNCAFLLTSEKKISSNFSPSMRRRQPNIVRKINV